MADGLYRVWILNLSATDSNNRWNEDSVSDRCDCLKNLFSKVVALPSCPYSSVDWFDASGGQTFDPGEVLVCFVASMQNSLVARISGQTPGANAGGATWPATTGVISEVFVDKALPDGNFRQLLANLAFHELMHNKLDTWGNQPVLDDIHTHGGGGLAMAAGIKASTLPSSTNLRLMATNLQLDVPQLSVGLPHVDETISGMPTRIDGGPAPSPG